MALGERIKKLRRTLDLTQQAFGEKIGTTQNNIASYETGRRAPSAAALNNICKTFSVSEEWLRTGEGGMFVQQADVDELSDTINRLLAGESVEFKRRLIRALSTLREEHWILLEEKLKEILGVLTPPAPEPEEDQHAKWEAEARAEAEAYYREIIEEKKAEAGFSALQSAASDGPKGA